MVKISDFEDESGKVDWSAYYAAQVAAGETCKRCGSYICWGRGHPQLCSGCKELDSDGEAGHERYVRCPKCGHYWDPYEAEDYDALYDGDHELWCSECDHRFTVRTDITRHFTSPARIKADLTMAEIRSILSRELNDPSDYDFFHMSYRRGWTDADEEIRYLLDEQRRLGGGSDYEALMVLAHG